MIKKLDKKAIKGYKRVSVNKSKTKSLGGDESLKSKADAFAGL